MNYKRILLSELISEAGEKNAENILSCFSCPKDPDIDNFLKKNAIDFAKRGITSTHLVFCESDDADGIGPILVGYFAYTLKVFKINKENINKKAENKLMRYGILDEDTNCYEIPAPLLAQFSKNYTDGNNELISGNELMDIALEVIKETQKNIGGRVVYVECKDDVPYLLNFYEKFGFKTFQTVTHKDDDEIKYNQMFRCRQIT